MSHSKKIFLNTISIYLKLIISIGLGLFSTRIVLDNLGTEDFGLYSLIGGTVAMLAFFQSAMANASMRFLSYSIGKADGDLKKILDTTIIIHLFFAFILVFVLELIKAPVFTYIINIPNEKIYLAELVYHCFVITTFISIISIPYDAIIMAHEDFVKLSFMDILGIIMSFILALSLDLFTENLVLVYAVGMLAIQLILRIIKQIYSCSFYYECKIHNIFRDYSSSYTHEILSFTGWNILGSLAAISVTSLRSVVLNNFFGLKYNAADGITAQVTGKLSLFSSCISQALNPLMIKNEGAGDRSKLLWMMIFSTKISSVLYACLAIPVWVYLPTILALWLTNVPDGCVLFIRIVLIASFVEKLSFEITNAIRAVGKIKNFQITESLVILVGVPFAIFLFKQGFEYYIIYFVGLLTSLSCYFVRVYYGKVVCGLNISAFLLETIKRIIFPTVVICAFYYIVNLYIPHSSLCIISISAFLSVIFLFLFYFVGTEKEEKNAICSLLKKYMKH